MEQLTTNRQVLIWLCAFPNQKSNIKWKSIVHVASSFTLLIILATAFWFSSMFFVRFVSEDLESCFFSIYQIAGFGNMVYLMMALYFLRHKTERIFTGLSNIYDKISDERSFKYLVDADNQSEWLWMSYFQYILLGFVATTILMSGGSVAYCYYCYGQFDGKYVFRPYRMIFPWNRQTPFGYIGDVFFSIIAAESYFISNGSLLLLFISLCWYHQAFYNIFLNWLNKLNQTNLNHTNTNIFNQLICFRSMIQAWFLDTTDLYNYFILFQMGCSMVFLASVIFQLELQLSHIDISICFLMMSVFVSGSNLFLYCYFGVVATECYEQMSDRLYETRWQNLPVVLQKYIILMIGNAQRPLYYSGFDIAHLNLVTFCKLLKAVVTYYMMFKSLIAD